MATTNPQDIGKAVAAYTHPIYQVFKDIWTRLAHVREGLGGFLDGTYLIAHPREWLDYTADLPSKPTKKLKARRALARYENWARTILEAKKSALFREPATRRVGPAPPVPVSKPPADGQPKPVVVPKPTPAEEPTGLAAWWEDVDGAGCHIDDFMDKAWDAAATFGHVLLYMDREPAEGVATAADVAQPYLRMYTPLDVLDWIEDDYGQLTQVKFQEPAPRTTLTQTPMTTYQVRIVTETDWTLYDAKGKRQQSGAHGFGRLPVVPLYSQRRSLLESTGQSVLDNPQLFIDYYNLTSEIRELLRNQTFSILNVPLGTGPEAMTVEQAKTLMGQQTGTEDVLFSGAAAQYVTADATNVTVYQEERTQLLRAIFRLAGIQWESDSHGVEAEGSLKLKREEMNTRLSAYADELETTEYALATLWYRQAHGEQGEAVMDKDEVLISYPSTFNMAPFEEVLAQAQAAISLAYPSEVLKAIRKQLLGKFLPNLLPEQQEALEAAIDQAQPDLSPQEQLKMKLEAQAQAGGPKVSLGEKKGKAA